MPVGLEFQCRPLPGNDETIVTFNKLERATADYVPIYPALYSVFRQRERARFRSEGPGWEELDDKTVRERERLGVPDGEHPILNRTGMEPAYGRTGGELRNSFCRMDSHYSVFEPMGDDIMMGSSDPIAPYHQDGTVHMVARPPVDMTEADAQAFAEVFARWYDVLEVTGEFFVSEEAI